MTRETITIAFGEHFRVKKFEQEVDRIDVITSIGEDNYFFASPIFSFEGKPAVFTGGTAGPENLSRLTGTRWSLKEMIAAVKNGYKAIINGEPDPKLIAYLRTESRKRPRAFTLK